MPHPAVAKRLRLRPGLWSWPSTPALSSPGITKAGVTWTIEIAFGPADGPLRASGLCQWYDVSALVRGFSTRRGRANEFSGYAPGSASITFDNVARTFDPSNTAGPYYFSGKGLTPMRRVRISATIGVTTAAIFSGFITSWPITYPGMVDSEVTVSAVDGFRVLEGTELPGSAYGAAVLATRPAAFWPMQTSDDAGRTEAEIGGVAMPPTSYASGPERWTVDSTSATLPVGASASIGDGPGGDATLITGLTTAAPSLTFWLTMPTAAGTSATALVSASSSPGSYAYVQFWPTQIALSDWADGASRTTASSPLSTSYPSLLGRTVHVAVVVSSAGLSIYMNGSLLVSQGGTAGTSLSILTNRCTVSLGGDTRDTTARISNLAVHPGPLTAAQVTDLYLAGLTAQGHPMGELTGQRIGRILDAAGWPATDRAISTGSTVVDQWLPAGGSALAGCRACEDTEQGYFFIGADGDAVFRDRQWIWTNPRAATSQATLTDQGGISYRDIEADGGNVDFIRNDITVTYNGGSVREKDPAAQFYEPESITTVLPATAGFLARQLARYRLRGHKDPAMRVPKVSTIPDTDPATYAPLIGLELGDRITVVRTPSGGSGAISTAVAVQGIDHRVTVDGPWSLSMYCSPAPESAVEAGYWVLGDATYGAIGEAAPRIIPY